MRSFKHALIFSPSLVLAVNNIQSICNSTTSKYPLLIDATTESLETGLESGLFTSVDLVNAYIARILEVNATLHVVTELNPDALSIAAELDAERANGSTRGPLRTLRPQRFPFFLACCRAATDAILHEHCKGWICCLT